MAKVIGKAFKIKKSDVRSYGYVKPNSRRSGSYARNGGVTAIAAINGRGAYLRHRRNASARTAMRGLSPAERLARARKITSAGHRPNSSAAQVAAARRRIRAAISHKPNRWPGDHARHRTAALRGHHGGAYPSTAGTAARRKKRGKSASKPSASSKRKPMRTSTRTRSRRVKRAAAPRKTRRVRRVRRARVAKAAPKRRVRRRKARALKANPARRKRAKAGTTVRRRRRRKAAASTTTPRRRRRRKASGKTTVRRRRRRKASALKANPTRRRRRKLRAKPARRRRRRALKANTTRRRRRKSRSLKANRRSRRKSHRKNRRSTRRHRRNGMMANRRSRRKSHRKNRRSTRRHRRNGMMANRRRKSHRKNRRHSMRRNGKKAFRKNEFLATLKEVAKIGALTTAGFAGHKVLTKIFCDQIFDRLVGSSGVATPPAAPAVSGLEMLQPFRGIIGGAFAAALGIGLTNYVVKDVRTKMFLTAGMATSFLHTCLVAGFSKFVPQMTGYLAGHDGTAASISAMYGLGAGSSIQPHYAPISGMGEYFAQNGVGEYFAQNGFGSYGANPDLMQAAAGYGVIENQNSDHVNPGDDLDRQLSIAEAAAGVGALPAYEAAAGMGKVQPFEASAGVGEYFAQNGFGSVSTVPPTADTWIPGSVDGQIWAGTRSISEGQSRNELNSAGILETAGNQGVFG